MAFYNNQRHIIEIDGPSHYADYDETTGTYSVSERAYAHQPASGAFAPAEGLVFDPDRPNRGA